MLGDDEGPFGPFSRMDVAAAAAAGGGAFSLQRHGRVKQFLSASFLPPSPPRTSLTDMPQPQPQPRCYSKGHSPLEEGEGRRRGGGEKGGRREREGERKESVCDVRPSPPPPPLLLRLRRPQLIVSGLLA